MKRLILNPVQHDDQKIGIDVHDGEAGARLAWVEIEIEGDTMYVRTDKSSDELTIIWSPQ